MSVTARGGYQIIDFKNIPVPYQEANAAQLADGLLEQIKNTVNKPAVIYNLRLKFNDQRTDIVDPCYPVYVQYMENNDAGEIEVGGHVVIVLSDGTGYFESA